MLRAFLAVGLALHGLIHVIGFVVPWRLADIKGFSYSTAVVWGWFHIGDAGARALGLGWLLGAVAFLAAALGLWLEATWAMPIIAMAAALSIVLCLAGSPAASAGLLIDLLVVLVLVLSRATAGASP